MKLENYYISGLPINLKGTLGIIYQPTIKDLFESGVTNSEIVSPFFVIEKMYYQALENINYKFELLYYFYTLSEINKKINNDESNIYDMFLKSISLLYKTDIENIKFITNDTIEESGILISNNNGKFLIDYDNYDKISDVILEMFCIDKQSVYEEEKEEKWKENTGSAREKKMIEYFKKKEKKKKEKEALHLADYINIVCHINGFVQYSDVINLTYYQLINSYKTLSVLKNYNEELGYRWSYKFKFDDKQKHWIKDIKIKDSTVNI